MGRRAHARPARAARVGTGLVIFCLALAGTPGQPARADDAPLIAARGLAAVSSDTLELAGLEEKFEQVAKRLAPSVVAISATPIGADPTALVHADTLNADRLAARVFDKSTRIVGTGFVIDAGGYLLTNDHVVAEAEQLWVTTDDRKVYPAIVVGTDPRTDLAVLKIPASGMTPVRFAKGTARRGQWSIALGNPYGLASDGEMCVSVGVVSGINRSLPKLANAEQRLYSNLIQTTAEINPGNSGGPLFDLAGEVIGINTAVVLPHKQANGIGFAIPVDADVLRLVGELRDGREVAHGFLGITVSQPTAADRRLAGLPVESGARVDAVEANSPAFHAGLATGDVVATVDGQGVRDGDHLVRRIALADTATPVLLQVYRDGSPRTVRVTLRVRPQQQVAVNRSNQRLRWGGLLIGPVPGHWSNAGGAGVMVLAINKAAGTIPGNVATGTVITAVAGKPVRSLADLQQVLNDTPSEQCSVEIVEPKDAVTSAAME